MASATGTATAAAVITPSTLPGAGDAADSDINFADTAIEKFGTIGLNASDDKRTGTDVDAIGAGLVARANALLKSTNSDDRATGQKILTDLQSAKVADTGKGATYGQLRGAVRDLEAGLGASKVDGIAGNEVYGLIAIGKNDRYDYGPALGKGGVTETTLTEVVKKFPGSVGAAATTPEASKSGNDQPVDPKAQTLLNGQGASTTSVPNRFTFAQAQDIVNNPSSNPPQLVASVRLQIAGAMSTATPMDDTKARGLMQQYPTPGDRAKNLSVQDYVSLSAWEAKQEGHTESPSSKEVITVGQAKNIGSNIVDLAMKEPDTKLAPATPQRITQLVQQYPSLDKMPLTDYAACLKGIKAAQPGATLTTAQLETQLAQFQATVTQNGATVPGAVSGATRVGAAAPPVGANTTMADLSKLSSADRIAAVKAAVLAAPTLSQSDAKILASTMSSDPSQVLLSDWATLQKAQGGANGGVSAAEIAQDKSAQAGGKANPTQVANFLSTLRDVNTRLANAAFMIPGDNQVMFAPASNATTMPGEASKAGSAPASLAMQQDLWLHTSAGDSKIGTVDLSHMFSATSIGRAVYDSLNQMQLPVSVPTRLTQ